MAGHSKWANIKHQKSRQDAKRGKIFTKLIREITTAAKLGGGDVDANPRLRAAVDKAYAGNMTKDTIQRAVKRGAGGDAGAEMFESRYEGYGPNGVAVMVDCLSDNKNRTVAEVRHAFSKCGGNMGTDGSVSYLFTKCGILTFAPDTDEEKLMEHAIEAGADDVKTYDDGSIEVITTPELFETVRDGLTSDGFTPADAEVTMVASTQVEISDPEEAEKMTKLIDMLEDLDDVQNVYSNADITTE